MTELSKINAAKKSLERLISWSLNKNQLIPSTTKVNKSVSIKAIEVNDIIDKYQKTYIENFKQIQHYQQELSSVSKELEKIKSSKTYRLWQKFNKIKRFILRRSEK